MQTTALRATRTENLRLQKMRRKLEQAPKPASEYRDKVSAVVNRTAIASIAVDETKAQVQSTRAGLKAALERFQEEITAALDAMEHAASKACNEAERANMDAQALEEHEPIDMDELGEVERYVRHLADPCTVNPWAHLSRESALYRVLDFLASVRAGLK